MYVLVACVFCWFANRNVFRRVRKIAKSDCQLRHVRPSVRMEQFDTLWTDFYEILYLRFCRKSVEKIQVLLKFDKNNGYLLFNGARH
jgi:hypothetical protein